MIGTCIIHVPIIIDQNFNVRILQLDSIGSIPSIIFGSGAVIATIVGIWSILFVQTDLLIVLLRQPVDKYISGIYSTNQGCFKATFEIYPFSMAATLLGSIKTFVWYIWFIVK